MTEREAAWRLEQAMRNRGADALSFDTIVAADDQSVCIVQKIVLNRGVFPKESYPEYRTFARDVTKSYSSRIVLRKK